MIDFMLLYYYRLRGKTYFPGLRDGGRRVVVDRAINAEDRREFKARGKDFSRRFNVASHNWTKLVPPVTLKTTGYICMECGKKKG